MRVPSRQGAGYDVLTIGLTADGSHVRAMLAADAKARGLARPARLQGKFDPKMLHGDGGASAAEIERAARAMLQELGPQGLIANLGEGLSGKEDPAKVKVLVDIIHSASAEMIAAAGGGRK